jgi:hypothetical protein
MLERDRFDAVEHGKTLKNVWQTARVIKGVIDDIFDGFVIMVIR